MRRWLTVACLAFGSAFAPGCEKQAELPPIQLVDDSPVLGVWYLQAAGDQPVAFDSSIRFEFKQDGVALYERSTAGPEEPDRYQLSYNLTGDILSIDCASDAPGAPRITGKIEFDQDGQALRVNTHTDEDWLLTRSQRPGGAVEEARRVKQIGNRADPLTQRVQQLAYACAAYTEQHGAAPERILDLVEAGFVYPEQLTESGKKDGLPARFSRMSAQEQGDWLENNSAFVFLFRYAGTGQASSVVVCSLPENGKSLVYVGMANGAVFKKPAKEAATLLQIQLGELPARWPDSAWSREAAAGLGPLSD